MPAICIPNASFAVTRDLSERGILSALRKYLGEETRIDVQFVDLIPLVRTGKRQAVISKLSLDFQKLQYPEGPKV